MCEALRRALCSLGLLQFRKKLTLIILRFLTARTQVHKWIIHVIKCEQWFNLPLSWWLQTKQRCPYSNCYIHHKGNSRHFSCIYRNSGDHHYSLSVLLWKPSNCLILSSLFQKAQWISSVLLVYHKLMLEAWLKPTPQSTAVFTIS